MICTFYSHKVGFNNILMRVKSTYPGCSIEVSDEDEFQKAIVEIKGGLFKTRKKIKIMYRQRALPSWQIPEDDQSHVANNIRGLYRYVSSLPAKNQHVKALFLQKILTLNSEFSIIQEIGETREIENLIQVLALDFDAFLFVQPKQVIGKASGQHFLDKNLHLILDSKGNCAIDNLDVEINSTSVEPEGRETTVEQNERKEKTEAILISRHIKINKHLPCIESESEITIRTAREIAGRTTVLSVINMVAFDGMTGDEAMEYLNENNLWNKATPDEKLFLADPTDDKKIEETWKCEAIWVLMWALNKVGDLGFPDELCNLNNIPYKEYPIGEGNNSNNFINQVSESRTKSEILDANDLYYRLDWACVDARINNQTIEDINPSVVYHRHYALNWLINYMEQEWDDVSCDT